MLIQFDPFAFVVALAAFLVAWRAHYLAKGAPEKARRREIRDEIRGRIEALRESTSPLSIIIDLGQPLVAPPADFNANVKALDNLSDRVPETTQIRGIHVTAFSLASRWYSAFHDETQYDLTKARAQKWQQNLADARTSGTQAMIDAAAGHFDDYTNQAEKLRRVADASRTQVREGLSIFKTRADAYTDWLNTLDRGKAKR
ncbi:hypothetical protein [Microbacterium hydrocarbonoxydans]|uniref:Uncharacterized protein n=1 Tax=Microbacterium hydrocarbonoxydans TaxID=273678 RepID=A0A1H4MIY6_9MICO|nr:hypothetical protein [Microbacterium hydrocarbonoxydans]SEB82883.1 hypothetical protein SAMN04489807_2159 [Microbacterium hydrocarbonoxydans]